MAFFEIDGASVGALALSIGVCAEAAASKFMARSTVIQLLSEENRNSKLRHGDIDQSQGFITLWL